MEPSSVNALIMTLGGTVTGFVASGVLNHVFGGGQELKKRVDSLEKDRIVGIESSLKEINARCLHHQDNQQITRLDTITGALQKAAARFEEAAGRLNAEMASTTTKLDNFEGWVNDVREELRDHKRNTGAHGGHQG